jgi:hypothetical protein
MCEPMGRREIFLTFLLLVEIEGHFTNEFVTYVYETEDRFKAILLFEQSKLSFNFGDPYSKRKY